MTTRRGFLSLMLATASAPAIVKSSSLMKIWVPPQELFLFGPVTQELIAHPSEYTNNFIKAMEINAKMMCELVSKMYDDRYIKSYAG